jgi:hypothetical protein
MVCNVGGEAPLITGWRRVKVAGPETACMTWEGTGLCCNRVYCWDDIWVVLVSLLSGIRSHDNVVLMLKKE